MTEYLLTVDEFMDAIHGELEAQVDELIWAEPPEHRLVLLAHREEIIERLVAFTRAANVQARLTPSSGYLQ
jgi:hypothetical protein